MSEEEDPTRVREQVLFSIIYKGIPCYLTLILGLIRYLAIRNDAITGDISYSRLMKAKLIVSYLFGAIYIIPIIMAFTVEEYWLRTHPFYSLFYLIFTVVWIGLAVLMTLEQERHLTQVWYCHQFFWVTNWFFVIVFNLISFITVIYGGHDFAAYSFASIEIILSLITVGFMLKTKSLRLRRLEEAINVNTSTSSEKLLARPSTTGDINIQLEYKINKKSEVHFKLTAGKINIRVKRTLKEILAIEEYLVKYLDSKMPELRSLVPSIEKATMVKRSNDQTSVYESRLRSIDHFLQVISDTPELWTRDILIFLGIDKGSEQSYYLQKRNEYLQRKHKGIEDNLRKANVYDLPMGESDEGSYR